MEVALGTSGPRPTTLRTCPSRDARSRLVPPEEHARMRTSTRLVSAGAVAGLALLATASPATAHVSPDKTEVPVGAYTSVRSEEHTSELPSPMRNSYAVFFLTKK